MVSDVETQKLLFKIASAYYEDGLTQEQIGTRFSLSRVKVSRLLRQAREERIVQISVVPPQDSNVRLERELEHAFHWNNEPAWVRSFWIASTPCLLAFAAIPISMRSRIDLHVSRWSDDSRL